MLRKPKVIYLTSEQMQIIHSYHIGIDPNEAGVRNWGLLYMIPTHAMQEKDVCRAAATYIVEIARLQVWNDGNRRTALLSGFIQLRMNGLKFKFKPKVIGKALTDVKDGVLDVDMVTAMLQQSTIPKAPKTFEESLQWFCTKYEDLIKELADLD